jgi:hypothetical protein
LKLVSVGMFTEFLEIQNVYYLIFWTQL